jgi:hypothetical protein
MSAALVDEQPRPLLHDALIERATRTFAFSRRHDLYFANAQVVVRHGDTAMPVTGSSLALGESLARAKCRSELLEHWSQTAWERSGCPPLLWTDLWSGCPVDPPPVPANPTRRDATGLCAGPRRAQARVRLHGLYEVLERDTVTRFFDRGEGRLRRPTAPLPEALAQVGRRWGGAFDCFVAEGDELPPVAIVVYSRGGAAGAIGSACRLDPDEAIAHAASEALMMYTTARHWSRRDAVAEPVRGVVWASDNIASVLDELRDASTARSPLRSPRLTEADLPSAVSDRFGASPRACVLPSGGADLADLGVWRVAVPGASSPAMVTRQPWPVG